MPQIPFDPRELEWQRRYEEQDTPWDKGGAAPPLMHYLDRYDIKGRVLVPGCGRGHDVRALVSRPDCTAIGLDLSPMAVADAQKIPFETGGSSSASFIAGDFFALDPSLYGTFDWLVEHTCFCAIDPALRPDYVASAAKALRPGGKIFAIFFMNPDADAGPPFGSEKQELDALFGPAFANLEEWVPEVSFPGREKRELVRILRKKH